MSYVMGLGADAPGLDADQQAALDRLKVNYNNLRAMLMADVARLTAPPSAKQRMLAWASGENLDTNISAGQSLRNAIDRYDRTFAMVTAGQFDKAAELQNNLNTAVKMWSADNDPRPWRDLANAIIDDLKRLPRTVAAAAGSLFREAGAGLVSGLGPVGTVALVAALAGAGYLAWRMSPLGMLTKKSRDK